MRSRRGLLLAPLLVALSCRPGSEPLPAGRALEQHHVFTSTDGPRTPEGARLVGTVRVRVATTAAAAPTDSATLERTVRRAIVDLAERRLARGEAPAALAAALPEELTWLLSRDGFDVLEAEVLALGLPGDERRAVLRPTTDHRILLVGLDGYDWDVADPLMADGRLPVLASLVERGTRARLDTIQPILSPVIWTTVATGRHPSEHGIIDFLGQDAAGRPVPVTSNLRRTKAFWNVMSDAGVTVGVVAWWATWPAEAVDGFLVSDRVAYQLFRTDDSALPSAGKVHPPALWDRVAPWVVRPEDVAPGEVLGFQDASVPAPTGAQDAELLEQFASVLASTRTYARIALELHEDVDPRVAAYYFEGPDTASHLFMRFAPPLLPEVDPARGARYGTVVARTYELHDRILGRLLEKAGPDTVVMVVSDHGFRSGDARPTTDSRVEAATAADWHDRFGVLVLAGPGVRGGHRVREASVIDVFPTMLALLGMPVSEELDGRVLEDALTPEFLAAHPVRSIASFEDTEERRDEPRFAAASPEDRAIIESLVAIGYVSPAAAAGDDGEGAATQGAAGANARNNMGTILLSQGDAEGALAEFEAALELAPDFVLARVNRAHALVRVGRSAEAVTALERVLGTDPTNAKAISLLATLHLSEGEVDAALDLARTATQRGPRAPAAWYTLGRALEAHGDGSGAREAYARAAELDPDNPEPLNAAGNLLQAAGRAAEASEWYERAIDVDPTFAPAYNNLALQYQRLGRLAEALDVYARGRERLPGSSILLNNLATLHHELARQAAAAADELGRRGAAAAAAAARAEERMRLEAGRASELYREAIEANPLDPSPLNNLGALQGLLGDEEAQLRLYHEAVSLNPRYTDALHNIGEWHLRHEQWHEAHETFVSVLEIDPRYLESTRLDALALVRLGRGDEAVAQLDAALEVHGPEPLLQLAAGAIHDELGDAGEACRWYRAALDQEPGLRGVADRVLQLCGTAP